MAVTGQEGGGVEAKTKGLWKCKEGEAARFRWILHAWVIVGVECRHVKMVGDIAIRFDQAKGFNLSRASENGNVYYSSNSEHLSATLGFGTFLLCIFLLASASVSFGPSAKHHDIRIRLVETIAARCHV